MSLTKKQEAFVVKYIECGNATEAYKHAYDCKKMSEKNIGNEGYNLLHHPVVAPKIKELKEARDNKVLEKLVIDREFVTQGILDCIKASIEKDDQGTALKGYDMLGKMYDLNQDKQNDRLVSNKERQALVENYKQRLMDVTPKEK